MRIAVIGLGYVGLPLALALGKRFENTVGFDISEKRVEELRAGVDSTGETDSAKIKESALKITCDVQDLKGCNFFIVGVPTPVDVNHNPDLSALKSAARLVGSVLEKGAIVVFESTVYPGVTEDVCGPALEKASGLQCGVDFKLGFSPERINPGDKVHSLEKVVKVVSGQDADTLEQVAKVYEAVVEAGVHRAPSIQVAEAAKVIENTQRDLNIALMNELSLIFDRMGISTQEVLEAAGTKWNFLKFSPGLVGGHCISVDPYYLTTAAERLGYHPQVILAGRRINDEMGKFVARQAVKFLVRAGARLSDAKVGVFGLSFKENVSDLRNSRVPEIVEELGEFGCQALVHDPLVVQEEALHEYGLELSLLEQMQDLDALVLAVSHNWYLENLEKILSLVKEGGVVVDVKSVIPKEKRPKSGIYWSL